MTQLRYDGKVCIITGAGGGLGREYALFFASRGAKIVINDLGKTKAGEFTADIVAQEIVKGGGQAVANRDSVDQGEKIVAQAIEAFGRVDIVINNAGILRDVSFMKMKESDWDLVHKVHLKGSFAVSRAAWPHMRKQGYGRIINTASPAGIYGNFGQANYSAAKLGLHGFTRALHKEGEAKGIFTNTIAPLAATAMTETVMSKELLKALGAEHIVPLVAYLCHESSEKSGGLFELGGGWISELRWQRSQGVSFNLPFTPEEVAAKFEGIGDFETEPEYPENTSDAMPKMINNFERNGGKLNGNNVSNTTAIKADGIFTMLKNYLEAGFGEDAVQKCQATYNFNISLKKNGPIKASYGLDLKNGKGAIFAKPFGQPDASFTMDDEEFYMECMRKSNPQMAFLKGRMKIKGSMRKASAFNPDLFPEPTPENLAKYSAQAKL